MVTLDYVKGNTSIGFQGPVANISNRTRSKLGNKKNSKPEPPSLNYLLSVRDWRILCSGAFRLTLPKGLMIVKQILKERSCDFT